MTEKQLRQAIARAQTKLGRQKETVEATEAEISVFTEKLAQLTTGQKR